MLQELLFDELVKQFPVMSPYHRHLVRFRKHHRIALSQLCLLIAVSGYLIDQDLILCNPARDFHFRQFSADVQIKIGDGMAAIFFQNSRSGVKQNRALCRFHTRIMQNLSGNGFAMSRLPTADSVPVQ